MRVAKITITMYQDDIHTSTTLKANQMFEELVSRVMLDADRHYKNGAKITQTSIDTTVVIDYRAP